MNTYQPSSIAIEAYALMEKAAKDSEMTIREMAIRLGYLSGYDWQKAVIAYLKGESGIKPIPLLPVWNGESKE